MALVAVRTNVYLLFVVALIVKEFKLGPCIVRYFLVSFIGILLISWGRELV